METPLKVCLSCKPYPISVNKNWLKYLPPKSNVVGDIAAESVRTSAPVSLVLKRYSDDRYTKADLSVPNAEQLIRDMSHLIDNARDHLARIILALLPETKVKGVYIHLFDLLLETAQYFEPETLAIVTLLHTKMTMCIKPITHQNVNFVKAELQKLAVQTLFRCGNLWGFRIMESETDISYWEPRLDDKKPNTEFVILTEYRKERLSYAPYLLFYQKVSE